MNELTLLELSMELAALRRSRPKTPEQHRFTRERVEFIGAVMGLIELEKNTA